MDKNLKLSVAMSPGNSIRAGQFIWQKGGQDMLFCTVNDHDELTTVECRPSLLTLVGQVWNRGKRRGMIGLTSVLFWVGGVSMPTPRKPTAPLRRNAP